MAVEARDRLVDALRNRRGHVAVLTAMADVIVALERSSASLAASWHPLGFMHIGLGEVAQGAKLRFHTWLPHERHTQDPPLPIHDHIFHLESHVLTGIVVNHFYQVEDSTTGEHSRYDVAYDGHESILSPRGDRVHCRLVSSVAYAAGDQYEVPKDQFHATEVAEGLLSATVVLSTATGAQKPVVIGPPNRREPYRYRRNACSSEALRKVLRLVAEGIDVGLSEGT